MLGFLVDNIYVVFGDQVFQQSIGIPMGTNCAPLLADLFLYSYGPFTDTPFQFGVFNFPFFSNYFRKSDSYFILVPKAPFGWGRGQAACGSFALLLQIR